MEKILLCPGERPAVGFLAQTLPLVALPILGESLITSWLELLANTGTKEILILATDRPELVRAEVGDGSRWGVRVQVQAELRELTPAEVRLRYVGQADKDGSSLPEVLTIDHLPGLSELPLFRSYRDWFGAALSWMPR